MLFRHVSLKLILSMFSNLISTYNTTNNASLNSAIPPLTATCTRVHIEGAMGYGKSQILADFDTCRIGMECESFPSS